MLPTGWRRRCILSPGSKAITTAAEKQCSHDYTPYCSRRRSQLHSRGR
jgi:hypothetical protein